MCNKLTNANDELLKSSIKVTSIVSSSVVRVLGSDRKTHQPVNKSITTMSCKGDKQTTIVTTVSVCKKEHKRFVRRVERVVVKKDKKRE